MIQQQYYTRERRGLFRNTEGYDSIAKSEGLTDSFIKEYLHPFCFYSPPAKLVQNNGEVSEYPKALLCVHLPDGEMVVGQASYVGADFTGLRNTFFVHNLVVPKSEKTPYVRNPDSILLVENFCCDYDIEQGKIIGTTDSIDYTIMDYNPSEILAGLNITDDTILQMVDACIQSALTSKKIYVFLDVEPSGISNAAVSVLRVLLRLLPYEIRSRLGFITYLKEPENKKYLSIMFVDKNSLKANEQKIKRDFVFDLTGSRTTGYADISLGNSAYASFAKNRINNTDIWQDFFELTSVFCAKISLSPSVFDDITMFYLAKYDANYRNENSLRIIEKMTEYLHDGTAEYFMSVAVCELKRLLMEEEYLSDIGIVKGFVQLEQSGYNTEYSKYFLERFIIKNTKLGYEALQAAENSPVYLPVIDVFLKTDAKTQAIKPYISRRVENITTVEGVFSELIYWKNTDLRILEQSFFCQSVYNRLDELIRTSKTGITESCCVAYAVIDSIKLEHETMPDKFKTHINVATSITDKILLGEVRLLYMTKKEIEGIPQGFLIRNSGQELCTAVEFIQAFLKEKTLHRKSLNRLTDNVRNQVVLKVRELTEKNINPTVYHIIAVLFDEHDEMLRYVHTYNVEQLAGFLIWCLDNNVLSDTRDREIISKYIAKNYSNSAFREKINGDDRLKPVLKEVKFSRITGIFKKQ